MAVVDLKTVHLLESNSPTITIESHDWAGITDISRNSGIAARWSNLNWKFSVVMDSGILATVHSNGVFVGKVFITIDDIVETMPNEQGFTEIVRYITNNKENAGKLKINMLVKQNRENLDDDVPKQNLNNNIAISKKQGINTPFNNNNNNKKVENSIKDKLKKKLKNSSKNNKYNNNNNSEENVDNEDTETLENENNSANNQTTEHDSEHSASNSQTLYTDNKSGTTHQTHTDSRQTHNDSRQTHTDSRHTHTESHPNDTDEPTAHTDDRSSVMYQQTSNTEEQSVTTNNNLIAQNEQMQQSKANELNTISLISDNNIEDSNIDVTASQVINSNLNSKLKESTEESSLKELKKSTKKNKNKILVEGNKKNSQKLKNKEKSSSSIKKNKKNNIEQQKEQREQEDEEEDEEEKNETTTKQTITEHLTPTLSLPFLFKVQDLNVLDSVKVHYLSNNSLSVNVVCGSWGAVTDELTIAGQFGSWENLNWKILIKENNLLRVTVWSRGVAIGTAALRAEEVLNIPTLNDGTVDLFFKIKNEKNDVSGKVKISGVFQSLDVNGNKSQKNEANGKESKKLSPSTQTFLMKNSKNKTNNTTTAKVSRIEEVEDEIDEDFNFNVKNVDENKNKQQTNDKNNNDSNDVLNKNPLKKTIDNMDNSNINNNINNINEKSTTQEDLFKNDPSFLSTIIKDTKLKLPVLALIKFISVFDLKAMHQLVNNSPRVKIVCDRKSAVTKVEKRAGSTARWDELDWTMKINEDSFVEITVTSEQKTIGSLTLSPIYLISLPINNKGFIEFNAHIQSNGISTGKIQIIFLLKNQPTDIDNNNNTQEKTRNILPSMSFDLNNNNNNFNNTKNFNNITNNINTFSTSINNNANNNNFEPLQQQQLLFSNTYNKNNNNQLQNESLFNNILKTIQKTNSFSQNNILLPNFNNNNNNNMNNTGTELFSTADFNNFSNLNLNTSQINDETINFNNNNNNSNLNNMVFDQNFLNNTKNLDKLGILVTLNLQEIDLLDLKSVHNLSKNSPYVTAACGKVSETSDPLINAGNTGYWTELNWEFTLKANSNLRLTVSSKNVLIGIATFTTEKLLKNKCDASGFRKILTTLTSGTEIMNPTGKIKITYSLEIIKEPSKQQTITSPSFLNTSTFNPSMMNNTTLFNNNNNNNSSFINFNNNNNVNNNNQSFKNFDRNNMQISSAPYLLNTQNNQYNNSNNNNNMNAYLAPNAMHMQGDMNNVDIYDRYKQPFDRINNQLNNNSNINYSQLQQPLSTNLQPYVFPSSKQFNNYENGNLFQNYNNNFNINSNNNTMNNSRPQSPIHMLHTPSNNALVLNMQSNTNSNIPLNNTLIDRYNPSNNAIFSPLDESTTNQHNNINNNITLNTQQYGERVIDQEEDNKIGDLDDIKEFPFNIVLNEISATELPSVHRLSKNNPYVKVQCDNFYNKTKVFTTGDDISSWKNLDWNIPIRLSTCVVKVTVESKSKVIGTVVVNPEDFFDLPIDSNNIREFVSTLKKDGVNVGKLRLFFTVTEYEEFLHSNNNNNSYNINNNTVNNNSSNMLNTFSSSVFQQSSYLPPLAQQQQQQQVSLPLLTSNNQPSVTSTNMLPTLQQQTIPTSAATTVTLPFIQTTQQQQQQLSTVTETTPVQQQQQQQQQNSSEFIASTTHNLSIVEEEKSKDISNNSNNGYDYHHQQSQQQQSQSQQNLKGFTASGVVDVVDSNNINMKSGVLTNNVLLSNKSELKSENNSVIRSRPSTASNARPISATKSQVTPRNNSTSPQHSMSILSLKQNVNMFDPSSANFLDENVMESVRFQINSVELFDLPTVQMFKANSPFVSLACGKFAARTNVKEKAGDTALWENFNFVFAMEKNSLMRVLVGSEKNAIGACSVNRIKFLTGRKDEANVYTVFCDLERATDLSAGKVKLMYTILQ